VGHLRRRAPEPLSSLQGWLSTQGTLPSWYEALGRDTGRIARAAFTSELAESLPVERVHAQVLRSLDESTFVDLWTTRSTRFSDAGSLSRSVSVVPIAMERP